MIDGETPSSPLGEIFPLGINGTILAMADDKEEIKNATVSVAPQAAAEQI